MNVKAIINYFDTILKEVGYFSEIIIENENRSYLNCYLGKKDDSENLKVIVYEQKLIIPNVKNSLRFFDNIANENPSIESEIFIEINLTLLLQSHPKVHAAISMELQRINNTLIFPGFSLDESTGSIFFRFTFLRPKGFISKYTFLSILGMILLNVDAFTPKLESIINDIN